MGPGGGWRWVWGVALCLALILLLALAETDINRDSDGDGLRWEKISFWVCFDPLHAWGFNNTFRDHVDDLDDDNDGVLDMYDDDDDGDGIRDREASFSGFYEYI